MVSGHPINQPTTGLLTLHSEEFDPFISLAMLRYYLSLADANQLVEMSLLDQVSICCCCSQLSTSDQRNNSTLKLQDGHFAPLARDLVQVFYCPKVKATLWVAEQYYQDIPVKIMDQPEENLFIDVNTRVV